MCIFFIVWNTLQFSFFYHFPRKLVIVHRYPSDEDTIVMNFYKSDDVTNSFLPSEINFNFFLFLFPTRYRFLPTFVNGKHSFSYFLSVKLVKIN